MKWMMKMSNEADMRFEFDIFPPGGGDVVLRQIAPGAQSLLLLEPAMGEDGVLTLKITSSNLADSTEGVSESLTAFAAALAEALGQQNEEVGDDGDES